MPLILSADLLTLCQWWVDASYATHEDCKGHTGAGMSFGKGMALGYSWKHKQTAKSSTEGVSYMELTTPSVIFSGLATSCRNKDTIWSHH